jgi:hypothetical protein
VKVFMCADQTVSLYCEYAEKLICSITGDAAVWRLQVSRQTHYICLLVQSQLRMGEEFYGQTWPHHNNYRAQRLSEELVSFQKYVVKLRKQYEIRNAEQSPVFFDIQNPQHLTLPVNKQCRLEQ